MFSNILIALFNIVFMWRVKCWNVYCVQRASQPANRVNCFRFLFLLRFGSVRFSLSVQWMSTYLSKGWQSQSRNLVYQYIGFTFKKLSMDNKKKLDSDGSTCLVFENDAFTLELNATMLFRSLWTQYTLHTPRTKLNWAELYGEFQW